MPVKYIKPLARITFAVSAFLFAACMETPTRTEADAAKTSKTDASLIGGAEVSLELEQSAVLSKRNDIVLRRVCLSMISSAKDTLLDTIAASAGSGYTGIKNYPTLRSDRTWTLAAKSLDAKDSVLHVGSVAFGIDAGKTKPVKLSLSSRYATIKVMLKPLQAGMTRCELASDGVVLASANLPSGVKDGDSVAIVYDYLKAGYSVTHLLSLSVFSNAGGSEEMLYSGKTRVNFGTTPGVDQALSLKLDYLGSWVTTGAAQASLALGASAIITLRGEIPALPKPKGLVAWYPLDNNFDDASGFGNNGTGNGGVFSANGANSTREWKTDGAHDFFKVPSSASLSSTAAVTVAAWAYFNNTAGIQTIMGKWYSPDSWRLGMTDGNYEFSVCFAGGGQWGTPVTVKAPATPLRFAHLAGTFDGITVKLYVNGKLAASAPGLAQQMQASTINLTGGDDADKGFSGFLDEVRIYDYPLTEAEIGAIMPYSASYRAP